MVHVIDELATPGEAITAVHLGAGALTLPRYIEATRPGSRQQVIELERDLVELVRDALPWQRTASIRIRYGDARDVVARLPGGLRGSADLLVIDIFSGARTPAHVTSVEFYRSAVQLLAASGIVLVNIADGPGLAFARGQVATLLAAVPTTHGAGDLLRAVVRPGLSEQVHVYFHDTDLVDRRRRALIVAGLMLLARRRPPFDLDALAASVSAPERAWAEVARGGAADSPA